MQMAFYAHERNGPDGETVRQTVYEHLRGTARRAAECLRAAGLENAGILAGLLHDMQITKSVNGDPGEKRSSDTMGMKHFVRFGLYKVKGAINAQLAEKTGFSEEDAEVVKECLRTLFVNDASAARPDGSMEVVKLYWWRHNCKEGQYSSARVHRSVKATLKDPELLPSSVDDYVITLEELPGLEPEVIDGV